MTTTDQTPAASIVPPTGAQPIAMLATTRHTPVREMTELLTRRFGPGLQVRHERGRTIWLLPVSRKRVTR